MKLIRAHALISGRVQNVWFRDSTCRRARELGIGGWVRNLDDGRVEATFEGDADQVAQALDFVRQGPPQARVEDVDITETSVSEAASTFSIR
ncbi:MAG: acylphosphatase [Myxococcota bacterium]|nr:acylphosphatase [Myxococcota bacterium]